MARFVFLVDGNKDASRDAYRLVMKDIQNEFTEDFGNDVVFTKRPKKLVVTVDVDKREADDYLASFYEYFADARGGYNVDSYNDYLEVFDGDKEAVDENLAYFGNPPYPFYCIQWDMESGIEVHCWVEE